MAEKENGGKKRAFKPSEVSLEVQLQHSAVTCNWHLLSMDLDPKTLTLSHTNPE